jgi:hypothetical protein
MLIDNQIFYIQFSKFNLRNMNRNLKKSSFLVSVIFAVVFLSMSVNLVIALNTYTALATGVSCRIGPGKNQTQCSEELDYDTKSIYCPNCPIEDIKAMCPHKPTPGLSGCSYADEKCAEWINDDKCDWTEGVHICSAVCSDPASLAYCSQVMAQAKTAVQRANIGKIAGSSNYINFNPVKISVYDYVPLTGCCNPNAVDENGIPFNQCDWDHTNTYQCQKGDRTDGTSSKCPVKDRYGNIKYYNKQCCIPVGKGWCSGNEECCGNTDECINGVCVQGMGLSLTPNPVWTGKTVTATITNCNNCDGRKVYVGIGQYRVLRCYCTVSAGCSCTFDAPNVFTSGTSYIYYARVDKNGDRDYTDPGEEASATLKVYCKALSQQCSSNQPCCLGYTCSYGVCQQLGGCPVLKVWDGNEYKDVVKLNIHSERGKDTTTSIEFTMEPKDGKYYVKLSEIWYAMLEGSHIDSVKLVDESGNECKLVSAIHDKKGDVLTAIAKSDDVRIETKPGEEIDLVFEGCKGEEFVFSIEGYNAIPRLAKMALSQIGITIVFAAILVIALLAVMFGVMKNMKKKRR